MIRHYYHLYLDGDAAWQPIADEYAQAVQAAEFPVMPVVGLVGRNRDDAKQWLDGQGWELAAEASAGYEQVTLAALCAALPVMPDDTLVLYTHAKGAWRNMPDEDQWRRSMLWHVLFGWRNCVQLLGTHQAVGCHWTGDYFAGNFWWATAAYLRTLPLITGATEAERGRAEAWIGLGHPVVANLVEGTAGPGTTAYGALAASAQLAPRNIRRHPVRPAHDTAVRAGAGSIAAASDLEALPAGDRGQVKALNVPGTQATRLPGCR